MSLLQPNLKIPFNITRLSHIVLTSRDLDKTRHFYETGMGFEVTSHDAERLSLRAIEETSHHSLVFEKTDNDSPSVCRRIGYRMFSDDDIKKAHDYFNARGEVAKYVERPFQGLTLRLDDGVGVPIEFCAEMDQSTSRMQNFHTHGGGKLAFLDHIQIACHDVAGAYQWYNDLGFQIGRASCRERVLRLV